MKQKKIIDLADPRRDAEVMNPWLAGRIVGPVCMSWGVPISVVYIILYVMFYCNVREEVSRFSWVWTEYCCIYTKTSTIAKGLIYSMYTRTVHTSYASNSHTHAHTRAIHTGLYISLMPKTSYRNHTGNIIPALDRSVSIT